MDSQNATQVSSEFESALSAIMPDLAQLLQNYQLSEILQINVEGMSLAGCTCCVIDGGMVCTSSYRQRTTSEDTLGLTPEKAEQLSKDVESKLSEVWASLSPSVQQPNESFELRLLVNPAIAYPKQTTVCKWLQDNVLQCSHS
jgi:hypothetical protein